jgi:hypothetical protein
VDVVRSNAGEFRWWAVGDTARDLAVKMPLLVLLFLFVPVWLVGARDPAWRVIVPYAAGALFAALAIGRIGSAANHLLELSAALVATLGTGVALARRRREWTGALFVAAVAGQVAFLLVVQTWNQWRCWDRIRHRAELAQLESDIASAPPGPVLADEWMGLLPLTGRTIYVQPLEMLENARQGLWDPGSLVRDVDARRFSLITIYYDPGYPVATERWTPELLEAVAHNYTPVRTVYDTIEYEPRNP